MGRHELPKTRRKARRKSPIVLAAGVAVAAAFLGAGGDVYAVAAREHSKPVVPDVEPCCWELVAAPIASKPAPGAGDDQVQLVRASRLRVDSRFLPVGRVNEQGLQVRTILAARAISAAFPEIHDMGGVRPDSKPWHPRGLAIDVMIPNPSSAEGIDLGNRIVAYVLENADRFAMQDAIWRGMYYTPHGARAMGMGHYDHVHVTTLGGGYPTGQETYLR